MEEGEFTEAREDCAALELDYQVIHPVSKSSNSAPLTTRGQYYQLQSFFT
jgi:hypothetical protein